jgi:hypothetical protein
MRVQRVSRRSQFPSVIVAISVVTSLVSCAAAYAGVNVWTSNGPYGESVDALAMDTTTSPATVYAGTAGGVFRLPEGGTSWTAVNTNLTNTIVNGLAIDTTTSPATVYAGTDGGGVFRLPEGGTSWTAMNTNLTETSVWALAVDTTTNPATVYAGTDGGVFRLPEGGMNWANSNLPYGGYVVALAIDTTTSPATVYAGTDGGGVFRLPEGGASWTAVNTNLGDTSVYALAIDTTTSPATVYAGTYYGGVFRLPEGGTNWTDVNTNLTETSVWALAVDTTTNPATVYAGMDGGAFSIQFTGPTPTFTITCTPTRTPTRTPTPTITPTPTPVPNIRQLTTNYDQYGGPYNPWISDDGSVVVYDESSNALLATTDGRNRRSLTSVTKGSCYRPRPSSDGNRVVMVCNADVTGNDEIVLLDGIDFVAVTQSPNTVDNSDPSISSDGHTIAFTSNGNYTGGNVDGSDEIFLWRDGQALQQITASADDSGRPSISGDGQRVLFRRTVQNPDGSGYESFLYLYGVAAGTTSQITSVDSASPQLSRDGQWVLFTSQADLVGSNPNGLRQLYAQRIGGAVQQLTQVANQNTSISFAVNGDASRIAIVVSQTSGQTTTGEGMLLTSSGSGPLPGVPGDAQSLSFDSAGRFLAFLSREDPVRQNWNHVQQLFVAVLPYESDTPTPTHAPTRTPTPTPLPALAANIGAADTTLYIDGAGGLPNAGMIQIDDELVVYNGNSGYILYNVTRGACGTAASAHAAGARVIVVPGGCPPTPTATPSLTPLPTASATPTANPTATATAVPCRGDCNGDGEVTVDEILTMVNIALGNARLLDCEAADANHDGHITIDEILTAVNNALNGCVQTP